MANSMIFRNYDLEKDTLRYQDLFQDYLLTECLIWSQVGDYTAYSMYDHTNCNQFAGQVLISPDKQYSFAIWQEDLTIERINTPILCGDISFYPCSVKIHYNGLIIDTTKLKTIIFYGGVARSAALQALDGLKEITVSPRDLDYLYPDQRVFMNAEDKAFDNSNYGIEDCREYVFSDDVRQVANAIFCKGADINLNMCLLTPEGVYIHSNFIEGVRNREVKLNNPNYDDLSDFDKGKLHLRAHFFAYRYGFEYSSEELDLSNPYSKNIFTKAFSYKDEAKSRGWYNYLLKQGKPVSRKLYKALLKIDNLHKVNLLNHGDYTWYIGSYTSLGKDHFEPFAEKCTFDIEDVYYVANTEGEWCLLVGEYMHRWECLDDNEPLGDFLYEQRKRFEEE